MVDIGHLSLQEERLWPEEWKAVKRQGSQWPVDPERSTVVMVDVKLSNLEATCREVSSSHQTSECCS